uniref:Cytochrome P450 n=1 Tax=Rhabditophanes sp. KR3021 TaxID=114890 RepID=A0AC35U8U4_9BILA
MITLVFTVLLSSIVLYVLNFYNNVRKLPKGPFPLPLIGNAYQFDPKQLHKWILEQKKVYGPIFTIYIANPVIVLADVKTIKEALVTHGEYFAARSLKFPDNIMHDLPNVGVITSTGDMWQAQRRLTLKIMRDFGMGRPLMEDKVILSRNELVEHLDSLEDKDHVDFPEIIHLTIGNIINSVCFGFTYPFNDAKDFYHFTHLIDSLMQLGTTWQFRVLSMFPDLAGHPFVKNYLFAGFFSGNKTLREINIGRIKKAKETYKPDDEPQNFVHAAIKEISAKDSNYSFLNDDHINAMAFDMYIAGQETSTTTTKWLILILMKFPDIQQKIFDEINNVVGLENEIKLSHKNSLPYTMAFITEGQRWANIIPFIIGHKCTRDTTIEGKFIPDGSIVQPFFYGSNYDETVFEDPYEFKPERFLLEDGKTINKKLFDQNYSFGRGARVCAGQSLAQMELQLIVPTLIQRYEFSHPHGKVDLSCEFGAILSPRPFTCKIVRRN